MRKPCLQTLGVLRGRTGPHADRHPQNRRNASLASEHEPIFCSLIGDLVHGAQREVHGAKFNHRAQASQCHSDACASYCTFRNRCVDHTSGSKLSLDSLVLLEDAAAANVFAQYNHVRVTRHGVPEGQLCRLRIGHCCQYHVPAPSVCTSLNASAASGTGEASANAIACCTSSETSPSIRASSDG
ncbi:hypothetical protein D3C71_1389050 [compost metagenome]